MSIARPPLNVPSPRPTVGVQAAVFRGSKVLLQRRANVFGHGTWGLPGGHLEFGESFEEAASRELAEECGLRATKLRTVLPHNTPYERTHYVQIAVEVLAWQGEPRVLEPERCSELEFFRLTELPRPLFEPSVHILHHLSAREHTDAVQQRLSLNLVLHRDDGVPIRALAFVLLLGHSGLGLQRVFTPDRRKPKRVGVRRFPTPDDAWGWLRSQLALRVEEGYILQDCRGDVPLDKVLDSFPASHPIAVRRLVAEQEPTVHPHQLGLLPEHAGW